MAGLSSRADGLLIVSRNRAPWGCGHLCCLPLPDAHWMIFSRRDLSDFYCCWGRLKNTQDKANDMFCLSTVLFLHIFCQLWASCWRLRNEKKVMKLWVQSSSRSFVILIWGACNCQENYPVCLQLLDWSIPLVSVINALVQLLAAGLQLFSLALSSFPFAPLPSYKYFKQENGIKPFLLQSLQMICMLFSISSILSASPAVSYFFSTPYLWISVWLHLNYYYFFF